MVEDVPLRYSRKATMSLLMQFVGSLTLSTLVVGVKTAASPTGTFLQGVYIGLGVWATLWAIVLPRLFNTWYRIRGDTLVAKGLHKAQAHLPSAHGARLIVWRPGRTKRHRYLALEINSVRIKLGDPRMRCYYEAAGLRSLAAALEQSQNPDIRNTAQSLRRLADRPDASSWPAELAPTSDQPPPQ